MSIAIETRNLRREFNGLAAVDGVSLTVYEGEIFGLVGPDAAGKTTTLRMLSGVMRPTSGELYVLARDVRADPEAIKSIVGYMPQTFGLYGELTVLENLEFYADLYQVPPEVRPERIRRLLAFARLEPFVGRLAQKLSGGMRQKLALASVLIPEPRVLLLDEPTSGVDPVSRRDFWRILYDLNTQGVTLVVSTPYMDEAERCTRVAFMFQGKIIAAGAPDELRKLMRGELLELDTPHERRARSLLADLPGVMGVEIFGDRVHVVVEDARSMIEPICDALVAKGLRVTKIEPIAPGLEDVFVSLLRSPQGA
ncbi:MAG TPA: ABC transporter ATP-binding protein [Armatimonadota bacterium]|nr:ABC transporter ATP-binding protein [Armatimonadota bacterium]